MILKNSDNAKKKISAVITAVAVAILLAAVSVFFVHQGSQKPYSHTGFAMGSQISVTFYGKDRPETADEILSGISTLDADLISRKSEVSEIFRLNESGTYTLSDKTLTYLNQTLDICRHSDGALDITVGGLSALWDFDSAKNAVPAQSEIEKQLMAVGYEKVKVDGNEVTLGENQIVDLGAVGKGIACDVAGEVLKDRGVDRALLTVGGTVMTYSSSDDEKGWNVGIRTPDAGDSSAFMKIHLADTRFVSTSGNYEKYFEYNGRIFHHILDTETGYPAENELKSVTIVARNGLVSDALSTACYVLGREKSGALLEKYDADAIFVDKNNNVYVTEGISDSCTLLNESYTVKSNE